MKRLLGPVLLVALVLAGCGDAASDTASDPAPSTGTPTDSASTSPPTVDPSSGVEAQTVAILSQTAAGGRVDLNAVPLADEGARHEFAAQFNRPNMENKIARAVASATIPEGFTLMGAVVSIGCDVPPGVTVTQSPDGWVVQPDPVASPLKECFAAVTTVALVAVPA
ncbi:hypothetical protein ISU07_10205 [Nocardioides islandensis]|jgi:hypothetical protein|uniref:Lipoprotein n=1 Tax=Nocardioides islandensis TaxID=433663 RepID=A0A930YI11_9ACTN|nr:hypothetical protein [Nocardioides islandensis]MBF4763499.1 hypothetical protein [Nocardioides islandensis]